MASIEDCVKSKKNLQLLRLYAKQKLGPEWPERVATLELAIEAALEDIVDHILERFVAWSSTPENIAEVNVAVWQALRPKVTTMMRGSEQSQADKEAILHHRFAREDDDSHNDEDREHEVASFHAERHANVWQ